jgi:hypothetical protein
VYRLMNEYATDLVAAIPASHVADYDWLRENTDALNTPTYQTRYRAYWQVNAARLSPDFCAAYFAALRTGLESAPELGPLTHALYDTATHLNGRRSLQFSFASKLLHMANPRVPIYDSLVARFYFFIEPPRKWPLKQRVANLVAYHGSSPKSMQGYSRPASSPMPSRCFVSGCILAASLTKSALIP